MHGCVQNITSRLKLKPAATVSDDTKKEHPSASEVKKPALKPGMLRAPCVRDYRGYDYRGV